MTKNTDPPEAQVLARQICLHLGEEGRAALERCRHLLWEREPSKERLSRGLIVRIALRRLLLCLLGERANVADPADPFAAEYLDLVGAPLPAPVPIQVTTEEVPDVATNRPPNRNTVSRGKGGRK